MDAPTSGFWGRRKEIPEHRLSGCRECIYLRPEDAIFSSRAKEAIVYQTGDIVYIGLYTLPEWPDHKKFYLVRCSSGYCGKLFTAYPYRISFSWFWAFACPECKFIVQIRNKDFYDGLYKKRQSSLIFKWLALKEALRLWWRGLRPAKKN